MSESLQKSTRGHLGEKHVQEQGAPVVGESAWEQGAHMAGRTQEADAFGQSVRGTHAVGRNAREREAHAARIRQKSDYRDGDKAAPDNNIFFEERSNPLSSKGN